MSGTGGEELRLAQTPATRTPAAPTSAPASVLEWNSVSKNIPDPPNCPLRDCATKDDASSSGAEEFYYDGSKVDEVCRLPALTPLAGSAGAAAGSAAAGSAGFAAADHFGPQLIAMCHILGLETIRVAYPAAPPAPENGGGGAGLFQRMLGFVAGPWGDAPEVEHIAVVAGRASGSPGEWTPDADRVFTSGAGAAGRACVEVPFPRGTKVVDMAVAQPRLPDVETELLRLLGVPTHVATYRGAALSILDCATSHDITAALRSRERLLIAVKLVAPPFPASYSHPPSACDLFLARAFGRAIFCVTTRHGPAWIVHDRPDPVLESLDAYI